METVRLCREVKVLFFRAEAVQDKLKHHVAFGEKVVWDYASDDEDDADLIQNSTIIDLEIALIEYDVSVSRLEIRRRLEHFLGDSASETYNVTLHNSIRDTSGYRGINRVEEVFTSTERLCWLCMFAEQEGDGEHAVRKFVLG